MRLLISGCGIVTDPPARREFAWFAYGFESGISYGTLLVEPVCTHHEYRYVYRYHIMIPTPKFMRPDVVKFKGPKLLCAELNYLSTVMSIIIYYIYMQ
jgi:hypothetical protein